MSWIGKMATNLAQFPRQQLHKPFFMVVNILKQFSCGGKHVQQPETLHVCCKHLISGACCCDLV